MIVRHNDCEEKKQNTDRGTHFESGMSSVSKQDRKRDVRNVKLVV